MNRTTPDQRGLSLVEALAVVAVLAAIVLISAPPLIQGLRNSRLRAATRHVLDDVRLARSAAVTTGWEYRVVGSGDGGGPTSNRYRTMARETASIPWPALSSAPSTSGTLIVGEWVDVAATYPGVALNPGDGATFELIYGPAGIPLSKSLNFTPLRLTGETGLDAAVSISTLGDSRVD